MDFDEASKEWRKNKISCKNGYFQYKCTHPNCQEALYLYTTSHALFDKFASEFDLANRNNPNRFLFCEEHLIPK